MNTENSLNSKQKEAVEATEGPVLVVAGAGAGKTKVITERIKLLMKNGVPPEEIIAVTFTNKAAGEMKARTIEQNSDIKKFRLPFIGTFHALGLLMMKENAKKLGLSGRFTIIDEDDSIKLVKESVLELNLDIKQFDPSRMKHQISSFKNKLVEQEECAEEGYFGEILCKIWQLYEKKTKAQEFLDFDDLILKPTRLLMRDKNTLEKYQNRWRYIHVDEYQDTNEAQYMLSKLLSAKHRNIFVVGDIDQAIYSWRGADFRNVLSFQQDYPDAKIITLEENYRSTDIILEAANAVIINNKMRVPKNLWTKKTGREKIKIMVAEDEKIEAETVAFEILTLKRGRIPALEMAVLYRTNAQSRAIEEALLSHNIAYRIVGGVRFYERREIKDLLAYVRLVQNPQDEISRKRILNVPARGIGKTLATKIFGKTIPLKPEEEKKIKDFEALIDDLRKTSAEKKPFEFLRYAVQKTGYRRYIEDGTEKGMDRWQNVEELIAISRKNEDLEEFLEHVSLFSAEDVYEPEDGSGKVNLMTIHSSKGLEFEAVFVVGMEEGLFPHVLSLDATDLEEERRLCYVAITRAKTKLYLSLAARRAIFGERISNMPSRFLKEFPEHLLEYQEMFPPDGGLPEIIIE
ncbi:UvrD-helicase domain-containing protein [Candidatus Giovannonibacteria bacterium]|nr:UvrD-helicase domain-containing protein [Candidatus Giovannonibacteria bacterium]